MYGSLMQKACKVHDMASVTDYRRLAHHHRGLFFSDDQREEELQARFQEVAQPHSTRPIRVDVIMGRTLDVAQAGKQPHPTLFVTLSICHTAHVAHHEMIDDGGNATGIKYSPDFNALLIESLMTPLLTTAEEAEMDLQQTN